MRLLLFFTFIFLICSQAFAQQPLKILPLGDSLTEGGYNLGGKWYVAGGYRNFLKSILTTKGIKIDFVGSRKSGPVPEDDVEHEGYSGWRVDEVAAVTPDILEKQKPDIVLLMLGSNDIVQNYQLRTLTARFAALVDLILNSDPNVRIIVGSPTPTNNLIFNQRKFAHHLALKTYVALKNHPRVRFTGMFVGAGINLKDLTDGVHPTPSGYEKMARTWAKSIQKLRRE
ncbi:MAG: SGNH/GDSL hydrolase family protein [Bdellovibrionia bacterium]